MYIAQVRKYTSNVTSTKRSQQANRWVFRFRQNWSGPTAGLCRLLDSEFQTRTSRSEGVTTEGAAVDTWNSQMIAAGGSVAQRLRDHG